MKDLYNDKTIDTLRVDEKSLVSLYTTLDKRGCGLRDDSGYRTKPIPAVLALAGVDSQVRSYRASVRMLSHDWCSLLIGMYIHPNSRAMITIPTASEERQVFEATVTACEHLAGKYHEARLAVETKIEVVEFIGAGPTLSDDDGGNDASCMPPSSDIVELLEAATSLGADGQEDAFRIILDLIHRQAKRFNLEDVRLAAEQILETTSQSTGMPDPAQLSPIDTAVRALGSR